MSASVWAASLESSERALDAWKGGQDRIGRVPETGTTGRSIPKKIAVAGSEDRSNHLELELASPMLAGTVAAALSSTPRLIRSRSRGMELRGSWRCCLQFGGLAFRRTGLHGSRENTSHAGTVDQLPQFSILCIGFEHLPLFGLFGFDNFSRISPALLSVSLKIRSARLRHFRTSNLIE